MNSSNTNFYSNNVWGFTVNIYNNFINNFVYYQTPDSALTLLYIEKKEIYKSLT